MSKFVEKFLTTPHHRDIKAIVKTDGSLSRPVGFVLSGKLHFAKPMLEGVFAMAVQAGRDWAQQFLPNMLKTGQFKNIVRQIKDIDILGAVEKAIREIGDRATKLLLGPRGSEIRKSTLTDHGKSILRLRVVESYIASALKEWASRGITHVKRVELDDLKTCSLCIHLNTKEYEIDQLLSVDNPLTHDTHKNCRGAFTPIINNISKLVASYNPEPVTFDMDTANVRLEQAPIEFKPWLTQFFSRVSPEFKIKFVSEHDSDYSLSGKTLTIRYDALHDEDPREIITEAMASTVPGHIQKQTINDYRVMQGLGLVIPPLETSDDAELFKELYQQYLLNQLDDAYEVIYFKTNFDGTRWGKIKK